MLLALVGSTLAIPSVVDVQYFLALKSFVWKPKAQAKRQRSKHTCPFAIVYNAVVIGSINLTLDALNDHAANALEEVQDAEGFGLGCELKPKDLVSVDVDSCVGKSPSKAHEESSPVIPGNF